MYTIENKSTRRLSKGYHISMDDRDNQNPEGLYNENRAHYETYLKPRILSRKDHDKSQALNALGEKLEVRSTGTQAELLQLIINRLYRAPATVNMPDTQIPLISTTAFRNAWSLKGRAGQEEWDESEQEQREFSEQTFFQYKNNADADFRGRATWRSESLKPNPEFDPNSRPIYAALHAINTARIGAAPEFGNAAFYLRDHVKEYSTISAQDSFWLMAGWYDGPDDLSSLAPKALGVFGNAGIERSNLFPAVVFATKNQLLQLTELGGVDSRGEYIELQIHGGLSISQDASHVTIPTLSSSSLRPEINRKLVGLFGHTESNPEKS